MTSKGGKAGGTRNSALWGKGGRTGKLAVMSALLALVAPWGASARQADATPGSGNGNAYISKSLLSQAQANPNDTFRVIVQAPVGTDPTQVGQQVASYAAQANQSLMTDVKKADDRFSHSRGDPRVSKAALAQAQAADNAAHDKVTALAQTIYQQQVTDQFSSISGVSATLTGDQLANVYTQGNAGLVSITPDAPVRISSWGQNQYGQNPSGPAWKSSQLWPYASGSANNWPMDSSSSAKWNMPSIAIVDSGIQSRGDFGNRIAASVDLSSIPNHAPGDGSGHGTFVAGIAAGESPNYAGANPAAKLVDVKVMDSNGMGYTSDVIRACQWILDHQSQYNIGVANFSLHSDISAPFWIDPLDRAVEQLWFHGIVVVTAAGNYGSTAGPSGVLYSPSDDPFVITVGAADIGTDPAMTDDKIAPWSAWGYTIDGFAKPELSAPGRYMIAPVPPGAALAAAHSGNVVGPGYMELSGTSFAAPVVSADAAQVLFKHPDWTPDQVKGALMLAANPLSTGNLASGVGELYASNAVNLFNAPNPNQALDQFVKTTNSWNGSSYSFDSASWNSAARASASWDSVSWNSASWNSASWNSASWNSASWNSASWNSASWNSASWNSASWNSASWDSASMTDAAQDEFAPVSSVTLSAAATAAMLAAIAF